MVLNSGDKQKYSYSIDNEEPVYLNQNQNPGKLKVVNLKTKDEFLTTIRTLGTGKKQIILDELPKQAGHYLVKDGNQTIQSISYNFSRKESVPEFYSEEDLLKKIQPSKFKQFQLIKATEITFSETLKELSHGRQLWKYFIILAILFLFCEIAIIRFWK
jgi:hypothetical protein